jgi:NADPH-dependent glutamate synthase beta subunit-like oxidoreductase
MKYFEHTNAYSVEEAAQALRGGTAKLLAGGTDLLGTLKDENLEQYPERVVNIKTIAALDFIRAEPDGIHIGAGTRLDTITKDALLGARQPAVVAAAASVASPLIRNQATLGGNLMQDTRCWYYRSPDEMAGRLDCLRKCSGPCFALLGENRFHSIFGAAKAHATPCNSECPAGVNIPEYIDRLRAGDLEGAADILLSRNALPSITARVCTHFCQVGCNRRDYDDRVRVGNIERYVGDYTLEHPGVFYASPAKENGKRAAIVGSGPTGLSAAYYLRKAGFSVTVFEKMQEAGGMLQYAIPAYRLPKEVVQKVVGGIAHMGVDIRCGVEIGKDITVETLQNDYDAVFLSTGAWKRTVIGIDGEELTRFGLEFLVEVKSWMKDKPGIDVVVIGGGNVAVDVAVTAKRLGAKSVTMVSLESLDELPATKEEIDRAQEEGVVLMPSWGPKRVIVENDKVRAVELKRCSAVRDASGRFSPQYDESETTLVSGDSILLAVGQQSDLSFLDEKTALEINRGRIAVTGNQQTTVDSVFAGGDAVTGPSTVVQGIAAGRRAAEGIAQKALGAALDAPDVSQGGFLQRDPFGTRHSQSVPAHIRPLNELRVDLEDDLGLDLNEVLEEARRCLNCGCFAVHPSDLATVLLSLDATIKTNRRELSAVQFFVRAQVEAPVLEQDELVTEIVLPTLPKGCISAYEKFRDRKTFDFAVVGVASAYTLEGGVVKDARIALGAVAPSPIRASKAEAYLVGKAVNEDVAEQAAQIALEGAQPFEQNSYKVQVAKAMVKRSILGTVK